MKNFEKLNDAEGLVPWEIAVEAFRIAMGMNDCPSRREIFRSMVSEVMKEDPQDEDCGISVMMYDWSHGS